MHLDPPLINSSVPSLDHPRGMPASVVSWTLVAGSAGAAGSTPQMPCSVSVDDPAGDRGEDPEIVRIGHRRASARRRGRGGTSRRIRPSRRRSPPRDRAPLPGPPVASMRLRRCRRRSKEGSGGVSASAARRTTRARRSRSNLLCLLERSAGTRLQDADRVRLDAQERAGLLRGVAEICREDECLSFAWRERPEQPRASSRASTAARASSGDSRLVTLRMATAALRRRFRYRFMAVR